MSYYVADENGYVDDLASNGGFFALSKWLENKDAPETKKFFSTGETEQIKLVIAELEILPASTDKDIQDTIEGLVDTLESCTGIAIISDGVG